MSDIADARPSLDSFLAEAGEWLSEHASPKPAESSTQSWGEGEFSTAVFHALSADDEQRLIDSIRDWNLLKAGQGYHAISWPEEYGGLGLPRAYARGFGKLQAAYESPGTHEIIGVTARLIAPTIDLFGSPDQKERFVGSFLRTEELCCQLFSEPGAGSDLASLSCRAERVGDEWVVNGQKVWSSAAQFSAFGELIARTDPDAAKHAGMTAFLVPLDLPGIEIRPIRQMNGGASFNEVFFDNVRLSDDMRLGEEGQGWNVTLTTLGFERDHSDGESTVSGSVGGTFTQLLATARAMGVAGDHAVRQGLSRAYTQSRIEAWSNRRVAEQLRAGGVPGPEGSIGKLLWTKGMEEMSHTISTILGPRLVADSGEWGTYGWGEHVLGAPGYRIAGGSDEVQRNIIGEKVLGLPREPRPATEGLTPSSA